MKNFLLFFWSLILVLTISGMANATTLQFNPNDIFNYATTSGTKLEQQGTARNITYENDTTVQTYTGGTNQNLSEIQTLLDYTATAGYQGVSHIQFWLSDGANVVNWGETVVQQNNSLLTASTDEFGWTTNVEVNGWDSTKSIAHFNTNLGGTGNQNALSPDFNKADNLWSVTGDFYNDVNTNGVYDAGDLNLVIDEDYTLWFSAKFNNWSGKNFTMEGSILASAVPEPASILLLGFGLLGLAGVSRKKN